MARATQRSRLYTGRMTETSGADTTVILAASLPHLLLGEAVQRRRRHVEHREIEGDLPAMMGLVLDHETHPLPDGDLRAAGRDALGLEIVVAEAAKDRHRLAVHLPHVRDDVVVAAGELFEIGRAHV